MDACAKSGDRLIATTEGIGQPAPVDPVPWSCVRGSACCSRAGMRTRCERVMLVRGIARAILITITQLSHCIRFNHPIQKLTVSVYEGVVVVVPAYVSLQRSIREGGRRPVPVAHNSHLQHRVTEWTEQHQVGETRRPRTHSTTTDLRPAARAANK